MFFFQPLHIIEELLIERVLRHRGSIAEDDELHAGTGDGYVHAAQVAEESDLSVVVGTHHGDEDDVALLPLEAVDSVDGDEMTEGFEESIALDESACAN